MKVTALLALIAAAATSADAFAVPSNQFAMRGGRYVWFGFACLLAGWLWLASEKVKVPRYNCFLENSTFCI